MCKQESDQEHGHNKPRPAAGGSFQGAIGIGFKDGKEQETHNPEYCDDCPAQGEKLCNSQGINGNNPIPEGCQKQQYA